MGISCQIIRDSSGDVVKVLAKNGLDSKLYKEALEHAKGNKEEAIDIWSTNYVKDFEENILPGIIAQGNERVKKELDKIQPKVPLNLVPKIERVSDSEVIMSFTSIPVEQTSSTETENTTDRTQIRAAKTELETFAEQLMKSNLAEEVIILNEQETVEKISEITPDRYQIISEKGAQKIEEYKNNLEKAKELEKKGVSLSEISDQTGWYKFKGDWRMFSNEALEQFEVKEENIRPNEEQKISDVLDSENILFEMYPSLLDIKVTFVEDQNSSQKDATFEEDRKAISINNFFGRERKAALAHELSHAIQSIEGLPRGGNFTTVTTHLLTDLKVIEKGNNKSYDIKELENKLKVIRQENNKEKVDRALEMLNFHKTNNKTEMYRLYRTIMGEIDAHIVTRAYRDYNKGQIGDTYEILLEDELLDNSIKKNEILKINENGEAYFTPAPKVKQALGQAIPLFQILGEVGASRLPNAEKIMANNTLAKELQQQGKDAKAIKIATGWELGVDGKWRYEIVDGKMKTTESGSYKLEDLYDSPALYEAYPELKSMDVTVNVRTAGRENSWFMPLDNSIEINVKTDYRVMSHLIHEIQHAIQFKEGFAIGGSYETFVENPDTFYTPEVKQEIEELKMKKTYLRALSIVSEYAMEEFDDVKPRKLFSKSFLEENFNEVVSEELKEIDLTGRKPSEVLSEFYEDLEDSQIRAIEIARREEGYEGVMDIIADISEPFESNLYKYSLFGMYQRLAGEVESRNVEKRAWMNEDKRRQTLLEKTESIPRDEQLQVFKFAGMESENQERTPAGFVFEDKVYLNKDRAKLDTPIHEFAHLFNSWAKVNRKDIYNKGIELVKTDKDLLALVKRMQPNLEGEALYEEALAQAIGAAGENIINEAKRKSFKNWLKEFWNSIKEALGITQYTAEEVSKMTLSEFTDAVAKDLLKGRDVTKINSFSVNPENTSNYANLTEDGEGNFVFYHRGKDNYTYIKKSSGDTIATSRGEAAALSKVGGLAMYYTRENDFESMVKGTSTYMVKIPKDKVYDFNTDPLGLYDLAEERHSKEHPKAAFDKNTQVAYITKIATEKGYEMVVAQWGDNTRAQTALELTPIDYQKVNGNVIVKKFDNKYKSNTDKGYKAIIPESKQSRLDKVYMEIHKNQNAKGEYDSLYRLHHEKGDYNQEEITELIQESELPDLIKSKYLEVLNSSEGKRRSIIVEKTSGVQLEGAPKGVFMNVGMVKGISEEKITSEEIKKFLPKDIIVKEEGIKTVESEGGTEDTLSLKISRPLTDLEMSNFLKATEQMAIPMISDGKGVMYGTLDWGEFNPTYFSLPSGEQLDSVIKSSQPIKIEGPVGSINLREHPEGYQIIFSNVKDEFQGMGVGTEMYKKLIEFNIGTENIYGDFTRTGQADAVWDKFSAISSTATVLDAKGNPKEVPAILLRQTDRSDSNGEATLATILHYINERNKESAEPLNLQEKLDIYNMLIAYEFESSKDLVKVLPEDIANKIEREEEITNNIMYEEFIATTGEKNQFGKSVVQNPLVIEAEIAKQLAGITDKDEFDLKLAEIEYPSIIEEAYEFPEFDNLLYNKFSSMSSLEVLGEDLQPVFEPNRASELYESIDFSKTSLLETSNWIMNLPSDIWVNEETDIKQVLTELELKASGVGIDLEGLAESYNSKSQEEIISFLGAMARLENNENQENLDNFVAEYSEFFEVEQVPARYITELPLEHADKTLVYHETNKSEYESFVEDGLLKVDNNLYQKVEIISLDNLVEVLYNHAVTANNRVLPNEAYFGSSEVNNKRLINPENKEFITENIRTFARNNVNLLNVEENNFDPEKASQMLLYKYFYNNKLYIKPENNLEQDSELLVDFEGDPEYYSTQYLADFQAEKLKGRDKNTEEYRTILSKFRVTSKGLELINKDEITKKELRMALEFYPNKDLKAHAAISRNKDLKDLFLPMGLSPKTGQSLPQRRVYYKNNKKVVPMFKGDYKAVNETTISTKDGGQDFIRIKGDLFEKSGENSVTSFYNKIPTYSEDFYILDDSKAPSAKDMSKEVYQGTSTKVKINNLYTKKEEQKINNQNFNCI